MAFTIFHIAKGPGTWDHGYCIFDEDGTLVRSRGSSGAIELNKTFFIAGQPDPRGTKGTGCGDTKDLAAKALAQAECDRLNAGGNQEMINAMEDKDLANRGAEVLRKENRIKKRLELTAALDRADKLEADSIAGLKEMTGDATAPAENPETTSGDTPPAPEKKPRGRGRPKKN